MWPAYSYLLTTAMHHISSVHLISPEVPRHVAGVRLLIPVHGWPLRPHYHLPLLFVRMDQVLVLARRGLVFVQHVGYDQL